MESPELQMEDRLIKQLTHDESQWTLRDDIKNEDDLWDNFFKILTTNNLKQLADEPLTDDEKDMIKAKVTHPTFYDAAVAIDGANGQYRIQVPRVTQNLDLLVIDNNNIAGGNSVYEVVHQIQLHKRHKMDQNRRTDITLLINGLPIIHIELKDRYHPTAEAFNQIQKYISEQKFNGIFSNIQMFVITNGTDTKYIAASQKLRNKFLSGWLDKHNQPVHNYLDFAKNVLSIPMAHNFIAAYSVLDNKQHNIILLRPYQIHAIEAILDASRKHQSGFIWHTTGSGKTLTSYRVAHNLLTIPSIDKAIFLIDRKDLDNQTTQAFQSYAYNDTIDVDETSSTYDLAQKLTDGNRNVMVTTRQKLQTLFRWQANDPGRNQQLFDKLKKLNPAFIVDECHRTIAPETKHEFDKFFINQPRWYGFTGTPIKIANKRHENGNAAQTTQQLYGPCLHGYTIKDAIRDNSVLGFQVRSMQSDELDISEEDKSNKEKLDKIYVSTPYMKAVLKSILRLAYHNLGIYNINNRGYTYSSILTTHPTQMRPIDHAKDYYRLLKDIKTGKSDIKTPERIKRILPDFPKFAITFSVSQNEEQSEDDQEFLKEAIDDYNKEYGTHYSMSEVMAYNNDINNRLARKKDEYKPQSERLDLVIVVDRLLTGFDSQYLSTLYVDRPPMQPQDIIQYFSRTNRIFDQDKKYGNIVIFQYPDTFNRAIDDALQLYSSNSDAGDVMAPSWEESKQRFDSAHQDISQYIHSTESILDAPEEDQRKFMKQYQQFDKAFSAVQTYDQFDDINIVKSYGLTDQALGDMTGVYEQLLAKFRTKKEQDEDIDIDTEYELESIGNKAINYQYILTLMQAYIPQSGELLAKKNASDDQEIAKYINELRETNKPLADLMDRLWSKLQANPQQFIGQQADQILTQMVDDVCDSKMKEFVKKYNIDSEKLEYVINHYDPTARRQIGLRDLLNRSAYNNYVAQHGDEEFQRMLGWKKQIQTELKQMYVEVIAPLNNNY